MRPLQISAGRLTNHTNEKSEAQPSFTQSPNKQVLSDRLNLFYCVHCVELGISQAGTESTVLFFPPEMGPLCVHKSTNSSFACGALLAGQLCAGVSRKVMERLPVECVNRKQRKSSHRHNTLQWTGCFPSFTNREFFCGCGCFCMGGSGSGKGCAAFFGRQGET